MVGNYRVITLCGSTRFKDEFLSVQKDLTLKGNIVISVGLFGHSGDNEVWTEGTKEMLDDMHKRKIDMADEIFVINKNGYIGSSTKSEIEYAKKTGKSVTYLEEVNDTESANITSNKGIVDSTPEPASLLSDILLTDHLATTCAVCPSIQAVKAGTKTPAEHCKTCQSCRKNLKGYLSLLAYGGLSLLESEITPTALLDTPNSTPEQGTADPEIVFLPAPRKKPQPKGKTATYHKRYEKAIRRAYAEGKSAHQIANDLAISPTTVYKLLDYYGLPRKRRS